MLNKYKHNKDNFNKSALDYDTIINSNYISLSYNHS